MQLVEPKDKRPMVPRWTPSVWTRASVKHSVKLDVDILARNAVENGRASCYAADPDPVPSYD